LDAVVASRVGAALTKVLVCSRLLQFDGKKR